MSGQWLVRTALGRAVVLLAYLVVSMTSVTRAETLQPIIAEGNTELTFTRSGGSVVRVVIYQTKVGDSYPYKDALLWGGDVGELPKTVLASIQVKRDSETVFVPLSAFADFGGVKSASLEPTATGFSLSIHGGDTATAYDAMLKFDHGYLVSRSVTLREFPKQRWEKTSYSFVER